MSEKKQSIGALWGKESRNGAKYFWGVIEIDGKHTDIVVFTNTFKKESKHPDYRIFLSEPRVGQSDQVSDHGSDQDSVPF